MNSSPQKPPGARPAAKAVREAAAAWIGRRDAGLRPAEERELADWLDADPAHREEFRRIDHAWSVLDRPGRSGTADLLLGELKIRARRRRRRLAGLAAAAAVVAMVAAIGWQDRFRRPEETIHTSTKAVLLLPSVRSLPDGSVIELAEGADVTVDFSAEQRRVVLQSGEAHFQVVKNPARPFVVVARGVEVRAVGTAFVVQLGPQDIGVVVTEGRVAVDAPPRAAASTTDATDMAVTTLALVDAGNGVAVSAPGPADAGWQVRSLEGQELDTRTAWRRPRLEFDGTPLVDAAALMNRHNQVQLHIEGDELARERVSGVFGAQNMDTFVRVLETTFDAQAERRTEDEIVLRRAR